MRKTALIVLLTTITLNNVHAIEHDPCNISGWQKVTLKGYSCGDICFLDMTKDYINSVKLLITVPCDSSYNTNLCQPFEQMDYNKRRNLYINAKVKLERDRNYKPPRTFEEMESDFGSCKIVNLRILGE